MGRPEQRGTATTIIIPGPVESAERIAPLNSTIITIQSMKDFTRFIPIHIRMTAEFVFSALRSNSGNSYFVSVVETDDQSYMFTMREERDKSWKIVDAPKLPSWIIAIQARLQSAILENTDE